MDLNGFWLNFLVCSTNNMSVVISEKIATVLSRLIKGSQSLLGICWCWMWSFSHSETLSSVGSKLMGGPERRMVKETLWIMSSSLSAGKYDKLEGKWSIDNWCENNLVRLPRQQEGAYLLIGDSWTTSFHF